MTDELLTMNDLRPTPEQKAAEGRRKARVVFVMAHGTGLALCCEESIVLDYLSEVGSGATVDGFPLDSHGVDYDTKLARRSLHGRDVARGRRSGRLPWQPRGVPVARRRAAGDGAMSGARSSRASTPGIRRWRSHEVRCGAPSARIFTSLRSTTSTSRASRGQARGPSGASTSWAHATSIARSSTTTRPISNRPRAAPRPAPSGLSSAPTSPSRSHRHEPHPITVDRRAGRQSQRLPERGVRPSVHPRRRRRQGRPHRHAGRLGAPTRGPRRADLDPRLHGRRQLAQPGVRDPPEQHARWRRGRRHHPAARRHPHGAPRRVRRGGDLELPRWPHGVVGERGPDGCARDTRGDWAP